MPLTGLCMLATVGLAQEVVELGGDEDLPSALDNFDEKAQENSDGDGSGIEDLSPIPLGFLRGRWSIRPVLALAFLRDDQTYWATRWGISARRQWWALQDKPVQFATDAGLLAIFPIGGAHGRRIVADAQLGPWLGPVGIRLGPVVRWDRMQWRNADRVLQDSLALGARATLTAEIGSFRPVVGVEAAWLALGDRPAADPDRATFPVIGDETAYLGGAHFQLGRVGIGGTVTWRETAVGAEVDAVASFGFQLF